MRTTAISFVPGGTRKLLSRGRAETPRPVPEGERISIVCARNATPAFLGSSELRSSGLSQAHSITEGKFIRSRGAGARSPESTATVPANACRMRGDSEATATAAHRAATQTVVRVFVNRFIGFTCAFTPPAGQA